MRRAVAAAGLALAAMGMTTAARADLGEPTERVVRRHFCDMTVEAAGFVNEFHCSGAEHQVEGVTSLAEGVAEAGKGEVCTTHTLPDGSTNELKCDGAAHQVEGVTSLVEGVTHEVVCGEEGANLDCEQYERDVRHLERDAEHTERDSARTAHHGLNDAGL